MVGDRVHPATRDLPLEWTAPTSGTSGRPRPTGKVHTVARYRAPNAAAGDGTDVDGTDSRSPGAGLSGGRSFYMGMGRTAASFAEERFRAHLARRAQWTAGLIRGNCKAAIDANYKATRLVRPAPTATARNSGESHGLVTAPNGWVLYIGRGDCRTDAERGALVGRRRCRASSTTRTRTSGSAAAPSTCGTPRPTTAP